MSNNRLCVYFVSFAPCPPPTITRITKTSLNFKWKSPSSTAYADDACDRIITPIY